LWSLCLLLGVPIAAALAWCVFIVIFYVPAWITGSGEVLLAWGWIGTPIGFLAAIAVFAIASSKVAEFLYGRLGGDVQ
jgi:hypothetical protein